MQGSTSDHLTQVYNTASPIVSWDIDHAGFLRCKTSVLKSCVLSYAPNEITDKEMPAPLRLRDKVMLLVPPEELAKDSALASLEGRPVSVDHYWQSTLGTNDVGSVAGKPIYDAESKVLFADILIKDPVAIQRITADKDDALKLVEQSAAYLMKIDWTPGVTEDGESYDGIQRNIQYNHVALVGEGEGRAGRDVRILNKRGKEMALDNEFTQMKLSGQTVRVMNADVEKVEKVQNEMDEKNKTISELVDPKKLEELSESLKTSRDEVAAKNAEIDGKVGEITELQAKLDELRDPAEQEKALNKVMNERENAQRVYNSLKGNVDSKDLQEASDKAKTLQGNDLRCHVVDSSRALNKRTPLSEDELANPDLVNGMFMTMLDMSDSTPVKNVAGADMTRAMNSDKDVKPELDMSSLHSEENQAGRRLIYKAQYEAKS